MNITYKSAPSEEGQRLLEALTQIVTKTLDRKRRLGHYTVTWQNGKTIIEGEDAPKAQENTQP